MYGAVVDSIVFSRGIAITFIGLHQHIGGIAHIAFQRNISCCAILSISIAASYSCAGFLKVQTFNWVLQYLSTLAIQPEGLSKKI